MMTNAKVGAALVGGYLLGRTKKAKLAIGLGMFLAGKKLDLDPRAIKRFVTDSPLIGALNTQVRDELVGATKAAASRALTQRVTGIADSLQERTRGLSGGSGAADEADEAEEAAEDRDDDAGDDAADEHDEPADDSGDEPAPRKSARRSASSGARRGTATRSGGTRKTAASGTRTAKKTASGAKTAAKGGRSTTRKATSGARRGGDDA
ncbi:hypothetical protein [Streptantibioticus silvisoli]|uniref:DNA primase n=1 Tax=Streptantibioticus silvisoli TaxID=2705255 RepID=A0ABT6W0U8_9ACTN|nr:hypothetical protein [Streptantibioticus silvisoli]MDI5964376.1 hypothetical protein [Streptantibioticus silvisoli]